MSHKIRAARAEAFLAALAAPGNVTLSAERAKVSRSWAMARRKEDAGFAAAWAAAVASAKARLAAGDSRAPPSGWGFLDGAELVVRGSNGRRLQIGRARLKQWTARIEARFLAVLASTCNVKAACAEVGMYPPSAYFHRKRWSAFALKWDEAIATGVTRLEIALVQNGCNLFSDPDMPPEVAMTGMTADHAIHLLNMHRRTARERQGRSASTFWRGHVAPQLEDVADSIRRKIEAVKQARLLDAEAMAREQAQWAARREGSGREEV